MTLRNTRDICGLGRRSTPTTALLMLATLGAALAMPPQFGIHSLQRRQTTTGSCDRDWDFSCMTCSLGGAAGITGYSWVTLDFNACKTDDTISWIACCQAANPSDPDVCLGPQDRNDCDGGNPVESARKCENTRKVRFAVKDGATSMNVHIHDGKLGVPTGATIPAGWTPPTDIAQTCGGGFSENGCPVKAAVIDLTKCTVPGTTTTTTTTPTPAPAPTCATVDCAQYTANGAPMQSKSNVNPATLAATQCAVLGDDCKEKCCAPSKCAAHPSLPENANTGGCDGVVTAPLDNGGTCNIACDEGFELSGNPEYTCEDGVLQNPTPPTCVPTCAAVDCEYYSANGFPMQYKSDVDVAATCPGGLESEDCKATCCAPTCSTPPTLPPNAVFGACADVATTPLENKNTCDLKCAEGYQQTDGSLGYTCKDGELDNADPPVCEPTCQTVQCSSLTTSYFLATVPMKRRDERFDTTICVGDCVEYCCEANPPTVPVPTAGTGFAKNENALSGTYCKSVPNPAGGVFSRSNKNWGFVNYLDLKSLTTAGKSETAKFFAGAGQCSATNKGTEVGEVSISAVPGAGNDVEVTVTFTTWPGQAMQAGSPRIQLTANRPYPTNPWGAGPGQYLPPTQTCTPMYQEGTTIVKAATCKATIPVGTAGQSGEWRYIYYIAHAGVIIAP